MLRALCAQSRPANHTPDPSMLSMMHDATRLIRACRFPAGVISWHLCYDIIVSRLEDHIMDLTQTTVHMPSILHSEVRRQAEVRQMSMSEMTRRALIRYLDLEPKDLLRSALHLGTREQQAAWPSLWMLVDTETTTAYKVLHDLTTLDMPGEQRTGITLAWLAADQEQAFLKGERATLVAAACLTEPDVLKERLLELIHEDLDAGRERVRHRVAHLLDRTGHPPVEEMLDLLNGCSDPSGQRMLLSYLSHLCRRNTVEQLRPQLVSAVSDGLSAQDDDVVLSALDLAAALRAGELVETLADMSERNDDAGHSALVSLGAVSARESRPGGNTDGMFSLDSPLSYRREDIDRPLPVPSWQQWSVQDSVREGALATLIRRGESNLTDGRAVSVVLNAVARSGHPEGLMFLRTLAQTLEVDGPIAGHLVANALGQFDDEEARTTLEELAEKGPTATRRVALKLLHSRSPAPEEVSAGPPTELFTLASLLRVLAVRRVSSPIYELDLNRQFATLSPDHATARRWMVGLGLMNREKNEYTLTPMGKMVSTVESWLEGHGIRGARRVELFRGEVLTEE